MALVEPTPDTDFLARALHIEIEILNAYTQHDSNDILSQWTTLEQQFQLALKDGKIPLVMKNQVQCIFDRIRLISQSFADVISKAADLKPNYIEALNGLPLDSQRFPSTLDSCSPKPFLKSLGYPRFPSISPLPKPSTSSDPMPLPEFIEHAYKYFVANIHNPYPSREEKQAIVNASNDSRVTFTSVSNWFTNARRRCGWAEILKSRCKGNREEMINLSKRIFVKEDPNRPVDLQIVAEFMEMKKNVETMYEKKTRTSAWIGDLDQLISTVSSENRRESDSIDRWSKKKMQAQALCKTNKAPKWLQRDGESRTSMSRTNSLSGSSTSDSINEDEEIMTESLSVVDCKRKNFHEDSHFISLRGSSPASSLSSFSFVSESCISRVPSLSWSDSGDEERPYKRLRSDAGTPPLSSPVSSELSLSADDSFNLNTSPIHLTNPPVTPIRGQKRPHEATVDADATPTAKRIRSDTNQTTRDTKLASPAPQVTGSTSAFTSSSSTLTTPSRRRSSVAFIDFDSLFTLGSQEPQPVEIAPPDTSLPLEVGIFDWSNPLDSFDLTGGLSMNVDPTVSSENSSTDFSQLFQFITSSGFESEVTDGLVALPEKTDVDAGIERYESGFGTLPASPFTPEQSSPLAPSLRTSLPDSQIDQPSFELWPHNHSQISPSERQDLTDDHTLDLSGLLSDLVSTQTLNEFGFNYSVQVPAETVQGSTSLPVVPLNSSFETPQSPSVTPTWASTPVPSTPAAQANSNLAKSLTIDLTGQDLTMIEKALRKEFKRRELEEKKAALERERAKLEELERELEDD